MSVGEKITKLRKENNYTQEQLASLLNVSRQSVSKWESDISYPETDKLIKMSEIFNCSIDYIIKDNSEKFVFKSNNFNFNIKERKSSKTIFNMPLYHIAKNAHGFFAIGVKASGVISIGVLSKGIISFGVLSLGLISFGTFSLALLSIGLFVLGLFSCGTIALGIISLGAISIGLFSLGAFSLGEFSIGALAIGNYFALGDNARAQIAIGGSEAYGTIFEFVGKLSSEKLQEYYTYLDEIVPSHYAFFKEIIKLFLR